LDSDLSLTESLGNSRPPLRINPAVVVKFFYGETTPNGSGLGQTPPNYRDVPPTGIEMIRMAVE